MKPFTTNSIRIAFLVVMTLWLTGCSSLDHSARNGPIPKGESIVFGSISGSISGSFSGSFSGRHSSWLEDVDRRVTVINTHNSKIVLVHHIKEDADGSFYWSLPPGQYAILDLQEHFSEGLGGGTKSWRIYAAFTIDSEQRVIYVGSLGITSSSLSVTDDFNTAVRTFHSQFPALNAEPIKQLLQLEKRR